MKEKYFKLTLTEIKRSVSNFLNQYMRELSESTLKVGMGICVYDLMLSMLSLIDRD